MISTWYIPGNAKNIEKKVRSIRVDLNLSSVMMNPNPYSNLLVISLIFFSRAFSKVVSLHTHIHTHLQHVSPFFIVLTSLINFKLHNSIIIKFTTLLVSPYLANTKKLDCLSRIEHATYNFPCKKYVVPKSKPKTNIVWLKDLFIVISNVNLIGNWKILNLIRIYVVIIGIRNNNTSSPRNLPIKIRSI